MQTFPQFLRENYSWDKKIAKQGTIYTHALSTP